MYTRIALGKSSAMDVVGGESCGSTGQLLLLYPMLFLLQGLQVCMRVRLRVCVCACACARARVHTPAGGAGRW